MATLLATNAVPLPVISLGEASIGVGYTLVGTFSSALVIMSILSTLDAAVMISFDGVHDHFAIPAGSAEPVFIEINFKAARTVLPNPSVFVKQIGAPSVGSIFVSGFTAQIP